MNSKKKTKTKTKNNRADGRREKDREIWHQSLAAQCVTLLAIACTGIELMMQMKMAHSLFDTNIRDKTLNNLLQQWSSEKIECGTWIIIIH